MEFRLVQSIYEAYQNKGVELTVKQVESKLSDLVDYWSELVIPDMVKDELI